MINEINEWYEKECKEIDECPFIPNTPFSIFGRRICKIDLKRRLLHQYLELVTKINKK